MSIRANISTFPDTKQTFSDLNDYAFIEGLFITKKENLTTDLIDLQDSDFWDSLLSAGTITPLHYIKETEISNEETGYARSVQDFDIKTSPKKSKKIFKYTWTIEKHELVSQFSGSNFWIIQYDRKGNVYLKYENGSYRGLKTDLIDLQDFLYPTESAPMFSPLQIEFREYPNAIENVGFMLNDIDRDFMSLTVESIGTNYLNFTAKQGTENITTIEATDVSVIDDTNGTLTFSTFNLNGGVYRLADFSDNLTTGCLIVVSSMYLGQTKYIATSIVLVTNNGLFDGLGNNILFDGEGNNLIFDN